MAAGAFFVVADLMEPMTVFLVAAGAAAVVFALPAAVAGLEEDDAEDEAVDAAIFFFTTVPALASLPVSLAFRRPRVVAADLLFAAAGAAAFLVREAAVVDVEPALELAVEAVPANFFVVVVVVDDAAVPRVPLALSTMLESRFGLEAVAEPAFTGDAGRDIVLFVGEVGRSRAGMMRAFDEVGDRMWPDWTDGGGSTAGAPRILFLGFSTAPWFSLSFVISSLNKGEKYVSEPKKEKPRFLHKK